MKRTVFLFFMLNLSAMVFAQIPHLPQIQQEVDKVSGLSDDLRMLESFGIKKDGSAGLTSTLNWLESRYADMGYTDIVRDSFEHPVSSNYNINLVVNKPGTDSTMPVIVICSHYDTKNGPGVNDNGTGVAATLEIAEILSVINTRSPVRFIHFAAEEDGLLGSTHYLNNILGINAKVRIVINLDQLGGTAGGTNNQLITCERDESSPDFNNMASLLHTDTLAEIIELYTDLETRIGMAFSSDYMPFQENGYIITGLWQYDGLQYPFYHQPGDSLLHVDTLATLEVTRGVLAAVLHFTQTPGFVSVRKAVGKQVKIYPNPASDVVHIELPGTGKYHFVIHNAMGQIAREFKTGENQKTINFQLTPGIYILQGVRIDSGDRIYGKICVR